METQTDIIKDMLVNVVLDRSGSMGPTAASTIDGYNEFINGLKLDKESKYSVTLIQFDATADAPSLMVSYLDKPLEEVPVLTPETYQPRGNTPLYDAIGECVRRVDAKGRGIMTVIVTDGQENASREFTKDAIKTLITSKEVDGWKFVFLGANMDSMAVGGGVGVNAASAANYAAHNAMHMFSAVADSVRGYASDSRSKGMRVASSSLSFSQQARQSMVQPPIPPPVIRTSVKPEAKKTEWKEEKGGA